MALAFNPSVASPSWSTKGTLLTLPLTYYGLSAHGRVTPSLSLRRPKDSGG